jgi:predicted HicB family RNase H-like nuclease
MEKEKMVQSTMRIPRGLWKEINRVAERQDLSMQQAVTRALREYVAREGGK